MKGGITFDKSAKLIALGSAVDTNISNCPTLALAVLVRNHTCLLSLLANTAHSKEKRQEGNGPIYLPCINKGNKGVTGFWQPLGSATIASEQPLRSNLT